MGEPRPGLPVEEGGAHGHNIGDLGSFSPANFWSRIEPESLLRSRTKEGYLAVRPFSAWHMSQDLVFIEFDTEMEKKAYKLVGRQHLVGADGVRIAV